jgi:hypothetical protein
LDEWLIGLDWIEWLRNISLSIAAITHPDYAALVDPLFAYGGKRV